MRSGPVRSPYTGLTNPALAAMAGTTSLAQSPVKAFDVGATNRGHRHMPNHRSRGVFAVAGTVLLLTVGTAGCGRRGLPAAVAGGDEAVSSPVAAATSVPTEPVPTEPVPTGTTDPAEPGAASPPAAATAPPNPGTQPTPTPLATPDLDSIERLLADLDAALGADATAATDEGSPK